VGAADPLRERYERLAAQLREPTYADPFRYYGGIPEEEIAATEAELGHCLPRSFRWFLGDFGGAELEDPVFGIGGHGPDDLVAVARRLWYANRPALPSALVPFAERKKFFGFARGGLNSEWACFDTRRGTAGECPVTTWVSDQARSHDLPPDRPSFVDWLEDQMEAFRGRQNLHRIPGDWTNAPAWDRYWQRILDDPYRRSHGARGGFFSHHLMERLLFLRGRPHPRLLLPGNGISLLPYAFAHCGFQVVALDLSAVAGDFVRRTQPEADYLSAFFWDPWWGSWLGLPDDRYNRARARRRMLREHRPGGSVTVLTEDIFTHEPEQPYDAIAASLLVHGFEEPEQTRLAELFFAWLSPGSVCLVESLNLWAQPGQGERMERLFAEAGFLK
jgi:hypothetical protein